MIRVPEGFSQRWQDCVGKSGEVILKLSVLRDLGRKVHADRSLCLAKGSIPEIQRLEQLETALSALHTSSAKSLQGTLELLLSQAKPQSPNPHPLELPKALTSVIPREKLERYDRKWEADMARWAVELGWCLWKLDCTIPVPKAESFHNGIANQLWPNGIVLFAESATTPPIQEDHWAGRWYCATCAEFNPNIYEFKLKVSAQLHWEVLFPTSLG